MQDTRAIYGIIGYPVEHSLSPLMHNAAFAKMEVDAEYRLFSLEEDQLEEFFKELREKSSPIFGLNVTVPYKESVLKYMDTLTPLVKKLKAVNTIVIDRNRKLKGFNTDAPGFLAHLTELNVETADKSVAILGAGGSARAIIGTFCMLPERPESIRIYNRSEDRVNQLLEDIGSGINIDIVETVSTVEDLNLRDADILINTTSVGLNEEDPILVDEHFLHPDLFVYDLIYNPRETLLLQMAKEAGAKTANGLGMLYYQGVLALQHWAEVELMEDVKNVMRSTLEEAVK